MNTPTGPNITVLSTLKRWADDLRADALMIGDRYYGIAVLHRLQEFSATALAEAVPLFRTQNGVLHAIPDGWWWSTKDQAWHHVMHPTIYRIPDGERSYRYSVRGVSFAWLPLAWEAAEVVAEEEDQ